jgi:hypothetical protein
MKRNSTIWFWIDIKNGDVGDGTTFLSRLVQRWQISSVTFKSNYSSLQRVQYCISVLSTCLLYALIRAQSSSDIAGVWRSKLGG